MSLVGDAEVLRAAGGEVIARRLDLQQLAVRDVARRARGVSVRTPSLRCMSEKENSADQLLCEHRWARPADGGEHPRCASCGLGYDEYAYGTVRAALSRMNAWP